jgi:NitT/TauT family transport system substrate-binding protein
MSDRYGKKGEGSAKIGGAGGILPLIFLAAVFGVLLAAGCERQPQEEDKPAAVAPEPVVLCRSRNMHLPLVVAEQKGFFPAQGLAVTVREFTLGRDALEAMINGESDLAVAAEPPVVEYALRGDDLLILATLESSDNLMHLAARSDRGIAGPLDLRGKRIATVKGTAPHYFLELFLEKHGMNLKDIDIAFMRADLVLDALISGQVDAISMTHNIVVQAREALLDKAVVMEAPGLYRNYVMLLANPAVLEKRPGLAARFLRAVDRAEDFISQRPEEAQAIAQGSAKEASGAETRQPPEIYQDELQYQLLLDHALLMGLEDTARWTLLQTGDSQRPVPNFLNLIASEPLQAVKPDSVRLGK